MRNEGVALSLARRRSTSTTIERHDTVEALAPEWEALADAVGAPPFVRPGWMTAWIDAFGRGRTVVLAVRRSGRLVGVAPMLVRGGTASSPANAHSPSFDLLALDREGAHALADAMLELGRHRVDLSFVDPSTQGFAAWRDAAGLRRRRTLSYMAARAPYVALDGDWEGYRASLDRKFRKELGRLGRRLEETAGQVDFVVDEGSAGWRTLLEEGLRIEGSGWKAEAGTAILSRPETAGFYRAVAEWAAERGWLRLKFLRLDGRAVAFDLALEAEGVTHVLKGGFDPSLRGVGPGMLLTERSIKRAFELGLRSYELHGTDDAYKLRWTDTTRPRANAQAFSRSATGRLAHLVHGRGRSAYRRARGRAPVVPLEEA